MNGTWLDLKGALRQLRAAPATALTAILTLAVGIGTTSAVFTFLTAVLTASTVVDDIDRRVALWSHNRAEAETKNAVSPGDFLEWRRRATLVDSMVAIRSRSATLGGIETPVRVPVQEVTPDYPTFFKWRPIAGRTFTSADAEPGAPRAVIVTDQFWRSALAARSDVVGLQVRVDGEPATIVGLLPPIPFLDGLFAPLPLDPADRVARNLFVWAHMRDGVTIAQLRAQMSIIGDALEREFPQSNRGWTINTRPLQEEFLGDQARLVFAILAGTVAAVLLIGCVNVANLLLARGVGRRGELSIRLALGAGPWRIARQLFTECGVIAAAGTLASLAVSRVTVTLFVSLFPVDSPWVAAKGLNGRALLITAATAIAATIAAGVAPVWSAARVDVVSGLQASGRSGIRATRRLTAVLVGGEVALAVLLLIVAGLLTRTLIALERLDPGFDVHNVLTSSVTLPAATPPAGAARWFESAVARARALPGVLGAAATSRVPFAGSRFNPNRGLEIEGRAAAPDEGTWAVDYIVTPGFFETMGVSLLEGRTFADSDGAGAAAVAIVNQAMATRYWPNRSPVGTRLRDSGTTEWRTVVGVVGDIRNDDADAPPIPYLYVPLAQRPIRTMTLTLRTAADASALTPVLRRAIAELDSDQALYDVRTMEDVLRADLQSSRVLIQVLGALALIALALAGVGVWGVASHAVGQRTREIGVRVALGARTRDVIRLMTAQGVTPVIAGLVIGLALGLGVARLMRSVLFGVTPTDPVTVAITIAVLAGVGLLATIGPALRAARLDPVAALRE